MWNNGKRHHKRYIWRLLACATAVMLAFPSGADNWHEPTLYHNDDVWYKDTSAPLLQKNGKYYIPIDILAMFNTISVEMYREDNLLLYTDTTEKTVYASILYDDQIAAVSGEIVRNVEIFRQNGYYYLSADWICGILGLETEYGTNANGETVLRLSNGEERRTLVELIQENRTDTQTEENPSESTNAQDNDVAEKWICVFVSDIRAQWELNWLQNTGLETVYALSADTPDEILWTTLLSGVCAVSASDCAEADTVNDMIAEKTYRRLPDVCGIFTAEEEAALTECGYNVIKPDFCVDSQTNPDSVYALLLEWLTENDQAILSVGMDGCSQRILTLIDTFLAENPEYILTTSPVR